MVMDNYLVCYIVDPDKVTVTDVLYMELQMCMQD